jgi:hypothetical protein
MLRTSGVPNKISTEVKKLHLLIDDLISFLDTNQSIKMLQITLQYILLRMEQATNEISEDLPLFIN